MVTSLEKHGMDWWRHGHGLHFSIDELDMKRWNTQNLETIYIYIDTVDALCDALIIWITWAISSYCTVHIFVRQHDKSLHLCRLCQMAQKFKAPQVCCAARQLQKVCNSLGTPSHFDSRPQWVSPSKNATLHTPLPNPSKRSRGTEPEKENDATLPTSRFELNPHFQTPNTQVAQWRWRWSASPPEHKLWESGRIIRIFTYTKDERCIHSCLLCAYEIQVRVYTL